MAEPVRLSKQIEDYLKNIYKLEAESSPVNTNAIAERMGLSPASVTSMAKKLDQMRLLAYRPYRGVTLTERGRKVALEIIRHHRLLELYLTEKMGLEWHKVDAEAEELEHVLSEELEAVLDKALGYPTQDPHGDPIPSKDGTMVESDEIALTELGPGQAASIIRVAQDDGEILDHLGKLGFFPDVIIEVKKHAPQAGTITVLLNGKTHTLGREVASRIFTTRP